MRVYHEALSMAETKRNKDRIYQDDLCFKIDIKPGSRDSMPLMIVTFREASNYSPDKHEWVPKVKELKFLTQTLKKISAPS
jgi:hypothetical protein